MDSNSSMVHFLPWGRFWWFYLAIHSSYFKDPTSQTGENMESEANKNFGAAQAAGQGSHAMFRGLAGGPKTHSCLGEALSFGEARDPAGSQNSPAPSSRGSL